MKCVLLCVVVAFGFISRAPGQTSSRTPLRANAVLSTPIPGALLAQATGLILSGEIPGLAVSLEKPRLMPENDFQRIIKQLDEAPFTLFAEEDERLQLPEFEGCKLGGFLGTTGVQQCTVGFVSGNPGVGCDGVKWVSELGISAAHSGPTLYTPLIAVLDSGIDPDLSFLQKNLFSPGFDFVKGIEGATEIGDGKDNDLDGLVDEAMGHGTHVATTILLVAPDAWIQPYRVVDADGIGYGFDVAEALLRCIQDGVDMVNLSLSMPKPTKFVSLLLALAQKNGIEVYSAVGNTGDEVLFPANFELDLTGTFLVPPEFAHGVYAVAATDSELHKADFSGFGSAVDLCGPGVRICAWVNGTQTELWKGTSMACAATTGAAALVRSKLGRSYPAPIGELLYATAIPIDSQNPEFAGGLGAGVFSVTAAIAKGLTGGQR